MDKYSLSIIIPHYNSGTGLRRLLASIPNKEEVLVIVVDDNSTLYLEELEICKIEFPNCLFLSNYTKKNSAGTCRNIGLDYATGKWLIFADADDYFLDGWYEIVSSYFESEYELIYFVPTSICEETGAVGKRHILYEKEINRFIKDKTRKNSLFLRFYFSSPCSKMILHRMVLENEIKFENILISNDVMFSCCCGYYATQIGVETSKIYCITQSSNSLTAKIDKKKKRMRLYTRLRRFIYLKKRLPEEDMNLLEYEDFIGNTLYELYLNNPSFREITNCLKYLRENEINTLFGNYFNPMKLGKRLIGYNLKRVLKNY